MSHDRPISITVENNTGDDLTFKDKNAIHGEFATDPWDVKNGSSMTFKAQDSGGALTGPQGVVRWTDPRGGIYVISYNHPMGTGHTTVDVSEPQVFAHKITGDLQQKDVTCTVTWYLPVNIADYGGPLDRPITITVQNDTHEKLQGGTSGLDHGKWDSSPATDIADGAGITFKATNNSGGPGPEGQVTWTGAVSKEDYQIKFVHPYTANPTVVTATTPGEFSYKLQNEQLQHHEASCTIEFYKKDPGPILRRRRNQSALNSAERQRFVNALLALKKNGVYDQFVQLHMLTLTYAIDNGGNWAHKTPAFLPWHRVFLDQFERALQSVDSTVTLPYWDWTVDSSPDPAKNKLFADDFMGPAGDSTQSWKVVKGPFTQANGWNLIYNTYTPDIMAGDGLRERFEDRAPQEAARYLQRTYGGSGTASLPTTNQVNATLAVTPYDAAPFSDDRKEVTFRNILEGWAVTGDTAVWQPDGDGSHMHNRVHMWVGGSMTTTGTSPNDPLFFLHHANIDRLWDRWEQQQKVGTAFYLPQGNGALPALGSASLLAPFDNVEYSFRSQLPDAAPANLVRTPNDVLTTKAMGYVYVDD